MVMSVCSRRGGASPDRRRVARWMSGVTVSPAAARSARLRSRVRRARLVTTQSALPVRVEKADRSPVTAADLAAERADRRANSSAWDPAIPIVTEERAHAAGERPRRLAAVLAGRPAGRHQGIPRGQRRVHGQHRADGRRRSGRSASSPRLRWTSLYCAGRGQGAWRRCGTARPNASVARLAAGSNRARVVESRSHPSAALESLPRDDSGPAERMRVGSSLKFCRVAEGAADLYPRFGQTMEWDVAAGDCIYRNSARRTDRAPVAAALQPADVAQSRFVLGNDRTCASHGIERLDR